MKKHALLTLLPFALVITGCSGSLKKASIFNEKFIRMNTLEYEVSHEFKAQEEAVLDFGSEVTPTPGFAEDVMHLSKTDGSKGLYSLSTRSIVLPVEKWKDGTITFEQVDDNGFEGRFFTAVKVVEEKEVRYIYDEYGNLIYSGENGVFTLSVENGNVRTEKGIYRAVIHIDGAVVAYAMYAVDYSFVEVLTLEQFIAKYPYDQMGDDLSDYGHPELILKKVASDDQERYMVFNTEKEKYVSSFTITKDHIGEVRQIGDYFYYQVRRSVQDREKKYDYAEGDIKYNLETYRVNYLNGKESKVKTNMLLSSLGLYSQGLYNAKGVIKYFFAEKVQYIDKDKTKNPEKHSVILDENLKVVADISGINFGCLEKFGDYYIAPNSNPAGYYTVYDSKLKEVGHIQNMEDKHIVRTNLGNGSYGFVDHTGKYLIAPTYTSIVRLADNEDFYMAVRGKETRFFKLSEDEKIVDLITISSKDYAYDTATSSDVHTIYEKVEDTKHYVISGLDGSVTPVFEPQTGDVDIALCEGATALNSSLKTDATVFQRGSEYRAIFTTTHTTYSIPSYFPVAK